MPAERLRASTESCTDLTSNHHETPDCQGIRLMNVVDEFTREPLEMLVERSIDAAVGRLVAERGVPEHLKMGQRLGAGHPRARGLLTVLEDPDRVHRPRLAAAEPIYRELPLARA
jgi:hypothetical protein